MLQCVAVRCSVFQCVVMWCSVLQCFAVFCSVLQCFAVFCSVLQRVAVNYSVLHPRHFLNTWLSRVTHMNEGEGTAAGERGVRGGRKGGSGGGLQYVAVCCSVLQCVAVCCSVLQCVCARAHKHYKHIQFSPTTNVKGFICNTLQHSATLCNTLHYIDKNMSVACACARTHSHKHIHTQFPQSIK